MKEFNQELKEILEDCNKDNWDSYDSNPIKKEVISNARKFVNKLAKDNIMIPEPLPMCTGDIWLQFRNSNYMGSFGIDEKNIISFVIFKILEDDIRTLWRGDFPAKKMPKSLKKFITKIFKNEHRKT